MHRTAIATAESILPMARGLAYAPLARSHAAGDFLDSPFASSCGGAPRSDNGKIREARAVSRVGADVIGKLPRLDCGETVQSEV